MMLAAGGNSPRLAILALTLYDSAGPPGCTSRVATSALPLLLCGTILIASGATLLCTAFATLPT